MEHSRLEDAWGRGLTDALQSRSPSTRWFSGWRTALFVVGISLAIAVLEAAFGTLPARLGGPRASLVQGLRSTIPSWLMIAAMFPAIFAFAARVPIRRTNWALSIPIHVAGAITFAALHVGIMVAIWKGLGWVERRYLYMLMDLMRLYAGEEMLVYASIVGAWHALHYHREALAREAVAADLRADLTQARIEALRLQLQPHFLFNTLHSITVLARSGETERLVQTVTNLADLLRSTLEDELAGDVSLECELEILQKYVHILGVRFHDRLTVDWAIEPGCRTASVPSLILLPLVENAFVHGIGARPGPGTIAIHVHREGGSLILEVEDTGPGFLAAHSGTPGHGIGLANVRARLAHRYGDRAEFESGVSAAGGARARIQLPYEEIGASAAPGNGVLT
jgi:two-component system, LytTR family, sensor kinase